MQKVPIFDKYFLSSGAIELLPVRRSVTVVLQEAAVFHVTFRQVSRVTYKLGDNCWMESLRTTNGLFVKLELDFPIV